jgi:hypothetical protein
LTPTAYDSTISLILALNEICPKLNSNSCFKLHKDFENVECPGELLSIQLTNINFENIIALKGVTIGSQDN